jgi:electron transfer flavoprotein beta subunit
VNISVCVKRVPDTETRIRVGADGTSIDPAGVKFVVSPYDEFAVEAALRLRESQGTGEVVTVSLGDEAGQDILRTTLAMGADRAILLKGEVTPDGLATARMLAAELEGHDAPLILLGVKAADDDQQQVGPMLATILGRPCATAVSSFEVDGDKVRCRREAEGGNEVVELPLPAVLTITKGEYEPRYASLKGIMAAKKKPLDVKDAASAPARIQVETLELPAERSAGRIVGEGPDAVKELVRILREEANAL